MKKLFAYSIIVLVAASLLSITAFTTQEEPAERTNEDIVIFSHALHSELIECESCHVGILESTTLNDPLLPKMDVCGMCHDVEDMDQCGTCHYEDVYETYLEKENDLYFSHAFHVSEKGMECAECHKDFTEINYSFESSQTHPPMMQCYTCHNDQAVATNACESCHVSTVDLLPQNHRTATFFDNHKYSAMAANADCAMCHDNVFCEDCHVSTTGIDESNLSNDFYTPYSPHNYIDDTQQQVITRVHDLNYRFTHGIDAKGKASVIQVQMKIMLRKGLFQARIFLKTF